MTAKKHPPDLYHDLAGTAAGAAWARLGLRRRAGVAAPLFSVYSSRSVGLGEIPDLALFADWCASVGLSLLQLLPMNDVGFDFAPYSAQSSFALEPAYLALDRLATVRTGPFRDALDDLRRAFPAGGARVDYGVKAAKLDLLAAMFRRAPRPGRYQDYVAANRFWLRDYALFKAIKEHAGQTPWETWEESLRRRDPDALDRFARDNAERVEFHQWLQWQLHEQFAAARAHAASRGVRILGDLPFLTSRDSADVWAFPDCFKLDLSAGAPPDMFFSVGQRWGMPPYDWDRLAARGYDYVRERLRYAQDFYDLFRIDHVVGVFRLWTIGLSEPGETAGLNGVFDPRDENVWEEHGRRLLRVMTESTTMLPCAEDLGVVPPCAVKVLKELGIPGMEVQRWTRDWKTGGDFTDPAAYRATAVAVASTHDTASLPGWWAVEAGTVDGSLIERKCREKGIPYERVLRDLFDPARSRHGRLRWRPEAAGRDKVLWALQRDERDVWEFLDMHKGTFDERDRFWRWLGGTGAPPETADAGFVRKALLRANQSVSVFAVQLLQDWFAAHSSWAQDPWTYRINVPGTVGDHNWSLVMPLSLEAMMAHPVNDVVRGIVRDTGRAP